MENIDTNTATSTNGATVDPVNQITPAGSTSSPSGVDNKPDYTLPDKFKTVNDLINSYGELEKKLGGFYGAPDEYKWELQGDEPDQAKIFREIAKQNNLSQNAFNKILTGYLEKENAIVEAQRATLEQVKKEIGNERIERAKNQLKNAGLSDDEFSAINQFAQGKKEFEVIEKILSKIGNSVSTVTNTPVPADLDKELRDIYSQPDYRYNPAKYHKRLNEIYEIKRNQQ
jgi:hypothetical protein